MIQLQKITICRLAIAETEGVMQQATVLLELQPSDLHAGCEEHGLRRWLQALGLCRHSPSKAM